MEEDILERLQGCSQAWEGRRGGLDRSTCGVYRSWSQATLVQGGRNGNRQGEASPDL